MIYTLTANPAIDYHMDLSASGLQPGEINRSVREEMFPGGKGLNVSVILSVLGIDNTAWGFTAGKTGDLLEALAAEKGCRCDFIRIPEGETRINVKLDCAQETAVNGNGPAIGPEQINALLDRVRQLEAGDTLILSGKLQAGTVNLYEAVCREMVGRKIRLIVDTEGEDLKRTFAYHPFLIKPNEEELLALYQGSDSSRDGIVALMKNCHNDGVKNVLVTLGGAGALLLTETGELYQAVISGEYEILSTVGAGDSTIAGFLAGMIRYGDQHEEEALALACAAGTATACRQWLAGRQEIESLTDHIRVSRLQGERL